MNIITIGSIMVIMPLVIALLTMLGILFNMLYHDTLKAYKEKDIITIVISILICFFIIGLLIIMISTVLEV